MDTKSLSRLTLIGPLALLTCNYCLLLLTVQLLLPAGVLADDSAIVGKHTILPRKTQKELGKAVEALRANAPGKARKHLEAAYRAAPNDADINYFLGVYFSQTNDWNQAKDHWLKAIDLDPNYCLALLSLSERFLSEDQPAEAITFAQKAVEAEPTSWRGHASLAGAYFQQGSSGESIREAERALQLGHQQAALIELLLAAALAKVGDKGRAIDVLEAHLRDHPGDAAAKTQLSSLKAPAEIPGDTMTPFLPTLMSSVPVPSTWLPPDVDENVPLIESETGCAVDELLQKAGLRVLEFVGNLEKFAATESVFHEAINKWGGSSHTQNREFDYVASFEEVRPGRFSFDEYRKRGTSPVDFPDGVETLGLPALALLFHPKISQNYEMTCEGLAKVHGEPAWQVHFRQRADRPNIMKSYRVGANGPSFPVAIKGRAWIAADTYQIIRLETDLVAPLPEIRLAADHSVIEYGSVHFRERGVDMWLPASADVYYDWRGKRAHRRHAFSNYLLFSVEAKQHISEPKPSQSLPR
jgi:tetratricopeptide (TPR) repeat protein